MIKPVHIIILILGFIAVHSCKKEERDPCLQPRTSLLRAHAYHHADTGTAIGDTLLPNPVLLPLTGGSTQYYFGGLKRISQLSFSLSDLVDSSSWAIRPDSAVSLQDTVTFFYERQLRFLSNACGYTNFYNIQRVRITTHLLDSATLVRQDVTSDVNVEHLKLYY